MQQIENVVGWQGVFALVALPLLVTLWAGVRYVLLRDSRFNTKHGELGVRDFWSMTIMMWFVAVLFFNPVTRDIVAMMTNMEIPYPAILGASILFVVTGQLMLLESFRHYYHLKPPVRIVVFRVVK